MPLLLAMNRMPSRAVRALLVGGLVSLVPAAPALAVDFAATPIATPTNVPDSSVVGDFNSDGQLDLATASSSDGVSPVTALVRLDGGFVPHPISMRGTTVDDVIAAISTPMATPTLQRPIGGTER